MLWLAFLGTREIGEVEAPDLDVARARAWAKWGSGIDRVVSAVEYGIEQEERQALERENRRRVDEDEDDCG